MVSQDDISFAPRNIFDCLREVGIVGECPSLDDQFFGGECLVLKVSFTDSPTAVAVRVLHPNQNCNHEYVLATVQSEARILEELEAKGFRWAPRCLGASLTFDNPIKHPFIALTWAEGRPLSWDEKAPSRPLRDSLLEQMASIQLSLLQCTLQDKSTTATTYFERRIRNNLRRVQQGGIPGLTEKDCLDQQALLDLVLGEDGNGTIFALDHGDIKPQNIIVDRDYNITCMIDWGFASLVPIAKAAVLPRFLWPTISAGIASIPTTLKDRQAYTRHLSSCTSSAASFMFRWQSTGDVDFRTLYLESISSKGVHVSMARIGWKKTEPCTAQNQMDLNDRGL